MFRCDIEPSMTMSSSNPSSSSTVTVVEGYVSSPRFAAPISICEIPDSLHDTREPTIAQLLQEKALYSFSEWPKVPCCHSRSV